MDVVPVWVKLPALPLHFWDLYHFRRIGDILGTFLEADLSFLETKEKKVARILVNLNIREGLAEAIILEWGPDPITQILDYENVPFRCRRCHVYGYPAASCKLKVRSHNDNRRKGDWVAHDKPSDLPHVVYGPSQSSADELDSDMPIEDLAVPAPGMVIGILDQTVQTSFLVEDSANGEPSGPGNPNLPLLSNVNMFLNNVSFIGSDWIDGSRKLSLSGKSVLSLPSVSAEVFSGLGSHHVATISNFELVHPDDAISVSEFDKPFSVEVPPPTVVNSVPNDSEESCPSPFDTMGSGYFLRSSHKPVLGLGKSSSSVRKGRGHKTNLSKA